MTPNGSFFVRSGIISWVQRFTLASPLDFTHAKGDLLIEQDPQWDRVDLAAVYADEGNGPIRGAAHRLTEGKPPCGQTPHDRG